MCLLESDEDLCLGLLKPPGSPLVKFKDLLLLRVFSTFKFETFYNSVLSLLLHTLHAIPRLSLDDVSTLLVDPYCGTLQLMLLAEYLSSFLLD